MMQRCAQAFNTSEHDPIWCMPFRGYREFGTELEDLRLEDVKQIH